MEPTPSPFDLRWRMFGIRVRVHPTFWLFSLLMGWHLSRYDMIFVLIWVLCTFVSILVHELGHVIAARIFGEPGKIILYSFGGLAVGNFERLRRWQRIVIALAGPAAGFALYGLVVALDHYWFKPHLTSRFEEKFDATIRFLMFMNLFWNLLNLVPVFPLDGGQVLREICTGISFENGFRWALGVSIVVGGLIAAYSVLVLTRNTPETPEAQHLYWPRFEQGDPRDKFAMQTPPLFMAILFGLLAVQCFLWLRSVERRDNVWEEE